MNKIFIRTFILLSLFLVNGAVFAEIDTSGLPDEIPTAEYLKTNGWPKQDAVRAFQEAYNKAVKDTKCTFITVDGKYGSQTKDARAKVDGTFGLEGACPKKGDKKLEDIMQPTFNTRIISIGKESQLTVSPDKEGHNIFDRIIRILMRTIGSLSVLFYVIAGFFIMTARGDENQIQKGKTILTYTSLGLVIAFSSYLMVQFVTAAIFSFTQ